MTGRKRFGCRLGFVAAAVGLLAAGILSVGPASGFGTSTPPPLPSVVAGGFTSCGLDANGNIYCWGDNVQSDGQAAPPAGQYTEVNLGYDTGCALNAAGAVTCWGGNAASFPPPAGPFIHVATGGGDTGGFFCALGPSGNITCWGVEDSGRISGAPTGTGFTQLALGVRNGCALNAAGAITCWGENLFGQLNVPAGLTASQITTGNFTACAIRSSDSTAVCWGRNAGGQADEPAGAFTQISAGGRHVCGIRPDGTITCWGDNTFGQASPPAGTYTQVSAGTFHTCAMPTSGPPAVCWGQNQAGRAVPQINNRLPSDEGNQGTQSPPPGGAVGTPYSYQYQNTFMSPQGTYTLTAGSLPTGLTLSPTGQITGTPTAPGTYTGTVMVGNTLSARAGQDSGDPITSTEDFSITITGVGPTTTSTTMPTTTSTTSTTVPGQTTVTGVSGSAYGAWVDALQGGDIIPPMPSVTLPPTGGGPITDTSPGVSVGALTTGAMNVSTQGTLGPAGQAQSTAVVNNATVPTNPPSEPPLFTAFRLDSFCQSTPAGSTGSVSMVSGFVRNTALDFAPAPNTVISDPLYGTVTVNEQIITNTPTSTAITVNAVRIHRFPADDIILGQVHCDVLFSGGTTPTTSTTSTTMPTTTTSTTMPTSTTSTTVVSPPRLTCVQAVNPQNGNLFVRCRIVDRDGLRRVNVVDTTTRVREQSIVFPRGHIITAGHFAIPGDGNTHRVHLNDAAGNVHVWLVAPDGTVTPVPRP